MAVALIFNFLFVIVLMLPRPTGGLNQSMKRTVHYATIHAIKNNLRAMLTDSTSWSNIVRDAINVKLNECYSPPYPDCTGFTGPIRLRNSADEIYYDSVTTQTRGFDLGGVACEVASANKDCIFQIAITWSPRCPVGGIPCVQPPGRVSVVISMKQDSTFEGVALDTKPWDFTWDVQ